MNHKLITYVLLIVSYPLLTIANALPSVTLVQDSVISDSALTLATNATYGCQINGLSFQQDIITTFQNFQYVAYYNSDRYVALARRQLPAGQWETIVFKDYRFEGDDAHNTISLGICTNDGTIHLAFDHHGDNLNYRVSRMNIASEPSAIEWSTSLFGPVTDTLEKSPVRNLTYPAFIRTPDGNLQLIYRYGSSGDGVWKIYDYNGKNHTWSNDRTFINASGHYSDSMGSSTSRCAYPNYYSYGPGGRLHVSWCWRESAHGANHDIMYAFSDDLGFNWYSPLAIATENSNSQGSTESGKKYSDSFIVASPSGRTMGVNDDILLLKKIDRKYGMMNTQAQAVDQLGQPHIIMWHCSDDTFASAGYDPANDKPLRWGPSTARYYFHYWLDKAGKLHESKIPGYAGSRPKLFIRSNGDAFLIYQACRDVLSLAGEIYFTNGDLKIYAASADSRWTNWQEVYSLKNGDGFFMNEMLGDIHRFEDSDTNILSVFVQEAPSASRQPTPIRIVDFKLE